MTTENKTTEESLIEAPSGLVVANKMPVRNHIRQCDIAIYNHMFSHEFCDLVIKNYEEGHSLKLAYNRQGAEGVDPSIKKDISVNVQEPWVLDLVKRSDKDDLFLTESSRIYRLFCESFNVALSYYTEDAMIVGEQAQHLVIDGIKIQKTGPSEGYHVWHYEASEHTTIRRVCFFILYLNDVTEGGETEFLKQSIRIVPEKGTLIIAPSNFTAMHRGNPPLSGDKYILTGWVSI